MNMKEQQYVCVLAECGSITRAAKELYISQPALSIYINNLEKSLNVKLFERVEETVYPDLCGGALCGEGQAMLRLEEGFEEELKGYYRQLYQGILSGFRPDAQPGCHPWWRPMSRSSPMWM